MDPRFELPDVAIVGGGPAGLHAALKAALLFRTALVLDKGRKWSRIFFAPQVDNIPGFPEGISGAELLRRQRRHVEAVERTADRRFVAWQDGAEVLRLARPAPGEPFELTARLLKTGEEVLKRARTIILATGVIDRQPLIGAAREGDIRAILPYANRGTVDYCLLCDGHVVAGKTVAVIGADRRAVGIAASLRDRFGAVPTVVACQACAGAAEEAAALATIRASAEKRGLPVVAGAIQALSGLQDGRLGLKFADGSEATFDKGFLALGWFKMNTELAVQQGALLDADGYVRTTSDCEVIGPGERPIEGLYAIGDIRADAWKQVPSAIADAESAVIHAFAERL